MSKLVIALSTALLCSGCASVLNDVTHPMKVETKTEKGEILAGADCKLSNDYGVFTVKSGEVVQVRRSNKNLDISCTHSANPTASGEIISRTNGAMFGNILLGGGIGAIIDHNKGTAYTYPLWVQLEFGKSLVFDRRAEVEGKPLVGVPPVISTETTTTANAGTPAAISK